MNKTKGFTIIELIVVIAIIAVLAAVVAVNVVSYISKSRDAAIKSNMEAMTTDAAVFYDTTGVATYTNLCTDTTTGFATAYAAAQAQKKSAGTVDCDSSSTQWRAVVQLNNPTAANGWWCVDYTGVKKELATDPVGTATFCP